MAKATTANTGPLKGMRVAILATDGFEQSELTDPKQALEEAGIQTTVASPEKTAKPGEIKG